MIVNGTAGDDDIVVTGSLGIVSAFGLSADVQIFHTEFANDRLDINTGSGNDTVDASGLEAGVIQLVVDDATDTPSPTPTVAPTTLAVVQTAAPPAELARPTATALAGPSSLPNAGGSTGSHGSGSWILVPTLLGGIIVAAAAWVLFRRARN